jgi:hypothetical protein
MMLNALSGVSRLTSLQLDYTRVENWYDRPAGCRRNVADDDDSGDLHGARKDRLTAPLSRLTQLRQVSLSWPHITANSLWSPLPKLTQLTALTMTSWHLAGFNGPELLPHGPTTLQRLALIPTQDYSAATSNWLQLRTCDMRDLASLHNLKRLTELRAPGSPLNTLIELPRFPGNFGVPEMRRILLTVWRCWSWGWLPPRAYTSCYSCRSCVR